MGLAVAGLKTVVAGAFLAAGANVVAVVAAVAAGCRVHLLEGVVVVVGEGTHEEEGIVASTHGVVVVVVEEEEEEDGNTAVGRTVEGVVEMDKRALVVVREEGRWAPVAVVVVVAKLVAGLVVLPWASHAAGDPLVAVGSLMMQKRVVGW